MFFAEPFDRADPPKKKYIVCSFINLLRASHEGSFNSHNNNNSVMKTITSIIASWSMAMALLGGGSLQAAVVLPGAFDMDFRVFGAISDHSMAGFLVPEGGSTLAVLGLALMLLGGVFSEDISVG